MNHRWDLARKEARRLVAGVDVALAARLADDPFAALAAEGLEVEFRAEQVAEAGCSIDGSYSAGPPPKITIARTRSVRRQRFSALHEYGHHLIRLDASVHDLFATQDDYGAALEEDICDAIAAELLLPDELVDRFIDNRGPTAGAVLALFKTSHASREAACVRAAQRLLGEGYVMLGEGDVARFTVAVETPYRVARGVAQGPDSVIAQAARTGSARREARVRFRSGNEGTTLFADAVSDEGYTFAVFTDIPAWQELTARDPDSLFPEHEGSCRVCDWDFTTPKALCRRCNEPFCPRCGSCWCGADRSVKERRCDHCTLLLPLSCFEADSTLCRDCTE